MKYAFLTSLIPKQLENEVISCSKHNMQAAANALQWHIYDGLCANLNEKVNIINILPIGSFPQYYTKPFIKENYFATDKTSKHINIGFCNVKFIRRYHQSKKVFKRLKHWCAESNEPKTIFVYTLSAHFTNALKKIKKLYPTVKICAIVADLPDMISLSSKKSLLEKLADKNLATRSYSAIYCIDAFVLLTKQMADYMAIKKPYVVMEGIATIHNDAPQKNTGNLKNILYTGTLHRKFGVLNLVEAFMKIDAPDYRLILCGVGDSETEIKEKACEDDRIIYKGQLKRDEILELQRNATILVNPRQNNEEFTKYSFPSKNLEYLSSGTPLVAYKLDGIPEEYSNYINYVEDDSIESLKRKLMEICEDVNGVAHERALSAFEFVKNEKNAQKQTEKIKKMLDAL